MTLDIFIVPIVILFNLLFLINVVEFINHNTKLYFAMVNFIILI
jgi:hypothetical protein